MLKVFRRDIMAAMMEGLFSLLAHNFSGVEF